MGESAKALLGGLIFLTLIGSLIVWVANGIPDDAVVWALRVGLPLVAVGAAVALWRASARADVEPDLIRHLVGKPFERDGVCFAVVPAVSGGVYFLHVVWQNQYSGACDFRVVIEPPAKSFSFGKRQFDGAAMDVECAGGAFGVASIGLGVPAKFQGKAVTFDVSAATRYREGRGELLRFKNGLRAGKADASGLGSAATTVALLAVGVIRVSRPATTTLRVPVGVAEGAPERVRTPVVRTLWRPGDGVEGVAEGLAGAMGNPQAQACPA